MPRVAPRHSAAKTPLHVAQRRLPPSGMAAAPLRTPPTYPVHGEVRRPHGHGVRLQAAPRAVKVLPHALLAGCAALVALPLHGAAALCQLEDGGAGAGGGGRAGGRGLREGTGEGLGDRGADEVGVGEYPRHLCSQAPFLRTCTDPYLDNIPTSPLPTAPCQERVGTLHS